MIRTVSAGDLGLDVLLAGGFHLVKRLPAGESATVLVRGGAGAGKTLVGLHVALELAKALGGDVAVGCVEILPTEYVAQVRGARPDIDERRVALLPARAESASGPRVYCGLLTELDPEAPDLVASLEALASDVAAAGGVPKVFVVDSLIEGYGIGASVPRVGADAVMKFAAQGACGLVLCEETHDGGAPPWMFAADTVIELGIEPRERGRWIEVRKHRFGASVPGRHELDLDTGRHPEVCPEPYAWVARDVGAVLHRYGWRKQARAALPALTWDAALQPQTDPGPPLEGALTAVTSNLAGAARSLAYGLRTAGRSGPALVIELDPLTVDAFEPDTANDPLVCYLATAQGPARALRAFVEQFARTFDTSGRAFVERVVVGDLQPVLGGPDALAWVEAVRAFASILIASHASVPIIAYASGTEGSYQQASSILSAQADLTIRGQQPNAAWVMHRWHRTPRTIFWNQEVTRSGLRLDALPRPPGRKAGQ